MSALAARSMKTVERTRDKRTLAGGLRRTRRLSLNLLQLARHAEGPALYHPAQWQPLRPPSRTRPVGTLPGDGACRRTVSVQSQGSARRVGAPVSSPSNLPLLAAECFTMALTRYCVVASAIFGFVGVLLGSLTTAVLTIYKDKLAARHDVQLRDQQYERDRKAARDSFQRESLCALQSAVSDLLQSAHVELDRQLAEFQGSGTWPARQWETPTAKGWSEAVLQLEQSRARIFDQEIRDFAGQLRTVAGDAIWATELHTARQLSEQLEPLQIRFNETVAQTFRSLF